MNSNYWLDIDPTTEQSCFIKTTKWGNKFYLTKNIDVNSCDWAEIKPYLHRENGPAIENGLYKSWYVNGKLHREDGPALEYANGRKEWFLNGLRHRVDDPAVECPSGTKEWWANGKLHRVDGPAIECCSRGKFWYLNGILFHARPRRWGEIESSFARMQQNT